MILTLHVPGTVVKLSNETLKVYIPALNPLSRRKDVTSEDSASDAGTSNKRDSNGDDALDALDLERESTSRAIITKGLRQEHVVDVDEWPASSTDSTRKRRKSRESQSRSQGTSGQKQLDQSKLDEMDVTGQEMETKNRGTSMDCGDSGDSADNVDIGGTGPIDLLPVRVLDKPTKFQVGISQLSSVVISGNISITVPVLQHLARNSIPVIFTDKNKPIAVLNPFAAHGLVKVRREQFKATEDDRGFHVAKQCIYAGLENKARLLLILAKNRAPTNPALEKSLRQTASEIRDNEKILEQ
nr:CRISPR-associated endonuclease Cas1 [Candidatus Sigynarchaeota archaeon]